MDTKMDTIKKKSRNSYKILLFCVGSNPRLCAISKIRTLSGVAGFFFSVRGFWFQFMALWRSDTESKKPKMEKSVDTKMDTKEPPLFGAVFTYCNLRIAASYSLRLSAIRAVITSSMIGQISSGFRPAIAARNGVSPYVLMVSASGGAA